jgi:hypothetical protein
MDQDKRNCRKETGTRVPLLQDIPNSTNNRDLIDKLKGLAAGYDLRASDKE